VEARVRGGKREGEGGGGEGKGWEPPRICMLPTPMAATRAFTYCDGAGRF
jgi:hypothetical protein